MSGRRAAWAALGALAALAALEPRPAAAAPAAPLQACTSPGWLRVNTPADIAIQSLAGDPAGGWVFAATRTSSGRTLHRGPLDEPSLWREVGSLGRVTDVAVQPAGEVVAGIFGDGVVRSADGGDSFGPRQLPGEWVTAVAAPPFRLYAASSGPVGKGIWLDADGTGTWQRMAGSEAIDTIQFWDLAVDPAGYPWAATHGQGLWKAHPPPGDPSGALAWAPVGDAELSVATVMSVAFDAEDPRLVYAGLGEMPDLGPSGRLGLRISRDGGGSWSRYPTQGGGSGEVAAFPDLVVRAVAASAAPGRAFAGTWGRGLYATQDGGRTWRRVPLPAPRGEHVGALLALVPQGATPASCELLFAATPDGVWVRNAARMELATAFLPIAFETAGLP